MSTLVHPSHETVPLKFEYHTNNVHVQLSTSVCTTGRQCTVPFSVQKWIISRRRCAMLLNISSEKSKVTRELALVELSLACLMVTWKFYDGSSKRITILSILVRSDKLLSTICFCIPSYVHQQLHLLNFQNLAHAILYFFFLSLQPCVWSTEVAGCREMCQYGGLAVWRRMTH